MKRHHKTPIVVFPRDKKTPKKARYKNSFTNLKNSPNSHNPIKKGGDFDVIAGLDFAGITGGFLLC